MEWMRALAIHWLSPAGKAALVEVWEVYVQLGEPAIDRSSL